MDSESKKCKIDLRHLTVVGKIMGDPMGFHGFSSSLTRVYTYDRVDALKCSDDGEMCKKLILIVKLYNAATTEDER